ncbi:hypothetical protein F5Y10DRAFT_241339 [Nemania abortiva]|nr:hypothetical protein F5Y10DRAFT_241339 [Nemania abortiva]
MPPHLHPRSRMTSSLFATTVAASFLVVGLPHILPCPAPRVAYADSASSSSPDGNGRRRARRRPPQQTTEVKDGIAQFDVEAKGSEGAEIPTMKMTSTAPRGKRECPVPKPGGVIGELIGFKKEKEDRSSSSSSSSASASRSRPEDAVEKIQPSNDR